jgi:pimeloyl-ACP methyl ester carboxylesterase
MENAVKFINMKLIFIHGTVGCKEAWQYQTQYFTGSEAIDLPGHPVGEPCPSIDAYVEWLHGYVTENGLAVMLNDLRACDKFDIMDGLGDIDIPLLAISGTENVMTPPKYSQYLVDNMQNARAVIIQGGAHLVFAEKPEEVNRAIEGFLKGNGACGAFAGL